MENSLDKQPLMGISNDGRIVRKNRAFRRTKMQMPISPCNLPKKTKRKKRLSKRKKA